ncbi:hypothetical protein C5T94_06350 [Raoultella ornithinolytica]|uniref:Uncharacterized protein n=1 Tax=Raoultella ornithinolytica TaxID=54291 RepID=A0A855EVW9_RAOOR|nr:hypothetical protein HY59_24255 [Raoultella ornithinolytica]AXC28031.1 hypothetical protein DSD31_00485 [Raoultella sp. X13]AOO58375.1 hypothetical protein AN237_18380 [Raoultella ornithinolytica]ASI58466.1 hypothetical protein CA210_09585 [Raoultella ornithinolytica]ATM23683.1 hypothetical protein CRN13_26445 [Raoultella ornithinolytica]
MNASGQSGAISKRLSHSGRKFKIYPQTDFQLFNITLIAQAPFFPSHQGSTINGFPQKSHLKPESI